MLWKQGASSRCFTVEPIPPTGNARNFGRSGEETRCICMRCVPRPELYGDLAPACECEERSVWIQLSAIDLTLTDTEPNLQWLKNARDKHTSSKGWVLELGLHLVLVSFPGGKISVTSGRYKHQKLLNLLAQRFMVWELNQSKTVAVLLGKTRVISFCKGLPQSYFHQLG